MWLAPTSRPGVSFGNTGKFFVLTPLGETIELPIPTGTNTVDGRPSFAFYNGDGISRCYMVGGWTDNLVLTENLTLARQSIRPPLNPIRNSAGGGIYAGAVASAGPGPTGNCIVYLRWWDDINKRRSPLSGGSPTFALANQARTWSNLPINPADACVTHIEGWVSMDGGLPRFAWRRDLKTLTVVENVATAALGQAETETLGRAPRGRFNAMWNDRQAIAGDDRHPDRLYLSPIGEPEDYGGFYLRTRKGEAIVALLSMRKQLLVFSATSTYVVEGYTEDDINMEILEPEIGAISHFAITAADGWAIVPSHRGIYLVTGSSFHLISREFNHTWRQQYAAHRDAYESSWAVNDIETNTYKLFVGACDLAEPLENTYWVLDYTSLLQESGGNFGQPALSLDIRSRKDECAAILKNPGARGGSLYVGSDDGIVRLENVLADVDDDGDSYGKNLLWRTGHVFPLGPGGEEKGDSAKYIEGWACVRSDLAGYKVWMYPGDETAWQMDVDERLGITVPAGFEQRDGLDLIAKCVHYFKINRSGRGITFEFQMDSPPAGLDAQQEQVTRFSGYGFNFTVGDNDRRIALQVAPPV